MAATCHYHLRRLRQIRRRVGREVTIRLVLALVMSRIDCCNSALAGLPQSTIAPLQRVQNAAAGLVFELSTSDYVTAGYWSCTGFLYNGVSRTVLHYALSFLCPPYLTATVQALNASHAHLGQRLRSTSWTDFSLPQLRTKFGERAFSHAGPAAWNSMPEHIRAEPDIRVFRKLLKTHLFNPAF